VIGAALFGPLALAMIAILVAMAGVSVVWRRQGEARLAEVRGGLSAIRKLGRALHERHPIRLRLEAAPVAELSLEELAHLLHGSRPGPAAMALLTLENRLHWIERFAQFSVHLGILGTVLSLTVSDPSDLEGFRATLPLALGTTFWGLVGALGLSSLAGAVENLLADARRELRLGLLSSFDAPDAALAEDES
jgi:hypothetical protein